jgi:hypothetical protein
MAIVTDNRNIWNEADVETGWGGSAAADLFTSEPTPIELLGCLGFVVSTATAYVYFTDTAIDLSDGKQVFVWTWDRASLDTIENGGLGIVLGDGTNVIGFHLAGSDFAAFRYDVSVDVKWSCMMFDTSRVSDFDNVDFFYTEHEGSIGNLNLASITQIGLEMKTLSKALGNLENVFVDIVRYGNRGLDIDGGTEGLPATFSETASGDRSNADQRAWGVIREYSSDVYGVQSSLTFGSSGTDSSWFEDDSGALIVFENRLIADDLYQFRVIGNSTGSNNFILNGANIQSAGPGVLVDFTSDDIDGFNVQNCTWNSLFNGIYFGNNTDATSHIFQNNNIVNCGPVYPYKVPMIGNSFQSVSISGVSTAVSGGYYPALVWTDVVGTEVSASSFINNDTPSACGILHPVDGEYNYYDLSFSGNTYDIIFLGIGTLIINNLGISNALTYDAPNGGTVVINQAVNWTFTGIVSGSELRIQTARGANPSGAELFHVETTDGEDIEWTFNFADFGAGYKVDIIVHSVTYQYLRLDNITLPDADSTLPIQQSFDRNYANP